MQLKEMVRQKAAYDVDPPLGKTASYIKNEMSKEGYRHLLAVGKHPSTAYNILLWLYYTRVLLQASSACDVSP